MSNTYMMEFFKQFDELKEKHPDLYLHIREFSREPRRWRVHVLGKSFAPQGDSEFVFAEAAEREEAFKDALKRLATVEDKISKLKEIQKYGTRL